MERRTIITLEGVEYEAQLARVTRTHLGYEDHGIFTVNIDFEGVDGGWGQGIGHRIVDAPSLLFPWVRALITFFAGSYGVWGEIDKKECYVLRRDYSGPILGLVSKSSDEYLLFASIVPEIDARVD